MQQFTTPYSPQQNGVSERKNISIMEMARCMMHEKMLPKKFWAEAANTAVFLLNRLPTKALERSTPFEVWYGVKPSVKNLKVFGCLCYTHVPEVKRDKLDKKAELGIFIGYNLQSKAYRIFHPMTGNVTVSRDVVFIEEDEWNWMEGKSAEQQQFEKQPVTDVEVDEVIDGLEDSVDDLPVRGTRSLAEIYERSNLAMLEPSNFVEAKEDQRWIAAMQEEISMIQKNHTWELVDRPSDKNVIGVKWVFRTKLNPDGSVNKHKARLVVKGYAQI